MRLKNIKEQFDKREIQPSQQSWSKLEDMLDAQEDNTKKSTLIIWIGGIAAALVLGLIAVPLVNQDDTAAPVAVPLVIEKENKSEGQFPATILDSNLQNLNVQQDALVEGQVEAPVETPTPAVRDNSTPDLEVEELIQRPVVAINVVVIEDPVKLQLNIDTQQPANEAVISEADRLLNAALSKLNEDQANRTAITSSESPLINPSKLLQETQWDMEYEQRHSIENTVRDGLGRLKREAVAFLDNNL